MNLTSSNHSIILNFAVYSVITMIIYTFIVYCRPNMV